MRGAHHQPGDVRQRPGIIPAYAGSTSPTRRRAAAARDHPRVCGEHHSRSADAARAMGSSPRMRGAPTATGLYGLQDGIIPAYAGSTPRPSRCRRPTRDHPRVCGEHTNNRTACKRRAGSSPRMRGALVCVLVHVSVVGIIPAYAGSTRNQSRGRTFYRDHPRVCGEHSAEHIAALAEQGSSPRMRGAPGPRRSSGKVTGIIPAYAGSTTKLFFRPSTCGDHPRVCGEHPTATVSECVERGSSPRMRGALLGELGGHVAARIIPAYAGSTRPPVRRWLRCGDHPRVCGEHSFSSFSQLSW